MSLMHNGSTPQREDGQVVALFALALPMFLAMCAVVVGLGNWFVHGKHLQTKADAGALAGGAAFQFPCAAGIDAIDTGIAAVARTYAGPTTATPGGLNPQVGGVASGSVHTVLNGPAWYDDDSDPSPSENLDICNGSVGTPMRLDVKVTEDNSFPLASVIPFFPDIKRKAVVQLFQTDGISGLLPIAVRAPEPKSALAIFYNEENGSILGRRYLIEKVNPTGPGFPGLPGGLQGWSTETALGQGWASVTVQRHTGVVIAVSYRGACPSGSPPAGVNIEPTGRCLEDVRTPSDFANVNEICNQGSGVQVANCYYTSDPDPDTANDEIVLSGLHYIRGYTSPGNPGDGPPVIGDVYLTPGTCTALGAYGSGYFTALPNVCSAGISASFDVGTCRRQPQGQNFTGPCLASGGVETRSADNVEVKYTLVTGTGNNDDICNFGSTCDLGDQGDTSAYSASGQVSITSANARYAVGLRIRLQKTVVPNKPDCSNDNFNGGCEWYFRGIGRVDTQPPNATFFTDPVTRAFRANSVNAGSIRWLRLRAHPGACSGTDSDELPPVVGGEGSQQLGAPSCFAVEMGLKGGLASDADDPAILWNDGLGSSQLGYLDCTESGPQNIIWEIMHGCPPMYGPNSFNYTPLCPNANILYALPNPGPPFDADWRPIRCVKTRTTSQGNDLIRGFNGRFFDPTNDNPSPQPPNTCPAQVGTGYIPGRNYWKYDGTTPFGYQELSGGTVTHATNFAPNDARKVVIFLTTPESFTGSGQNAYPITGAIGVYITGYGTIQGNGNVQVDDPCAGPLPQDFDTSGGSSGGRVVWGHFINTTVLSAGATPTSIACNPGGSTQPCVPVLVE